MWLLILQFVMALPQLFKLVMEIYRLIKDLRGQKDEAVFSTEFKDILSRPKAKGSDVNARLNDLLESLRARHA